MKHRTRGRRVTAAVAIVTAVLMVVAGCSGNGSGSGSGSGSGAGGGSGAGSGSGSGSGSGAAVGFGPGHGAAHDVKSGSVFDPRKVHTISVDASEDALAEVLKAYVDSQDKKWIKAKVTIDGKTFAGAGMRLKGNASLKHVTTSSKPADLPWRIRLDKYIQGRQLDGYSDFTVRHNDTATSMNEAVALDMLAEAGLASEHAIETKFAINGSAQQLRLTVQNLDDTWVKEHFPDAGGESVLYKAETGGNWAWHGSDGDYKSSFHIEAGPDNYAPLIKLLDLVNNGSDGEIADKLPKLVDLHSFAEYLALEELVRNPDDINGPSNNSYLFWSAAKKRFTVIAWDHNQAFAEDGGGGAAIGTGFDGGSGSSGGSPGGLGGGSGSDGSGSGSAGDSGSGSSGSGSGSGIPRGLLKSGGTHNPLVVAFSDHATFRSLYSHARKQLREKLIESGALGKSVAGWAAMLQKHATDLVGPDTVANEANEIRTVAG